MSLSARRLLLIAGVCAAAVWAWFGFRGEVRQPGTAHLEIRWHQGNVILSGIVRDAETQAVLVDSARARLGGESEQVVDWMNIDADAPPIADPAALGLLIRKGREGWHLRREAAGGWLAVQSPNDPASEEARVLAQRAFGPGVSVHLAALR